MEPSMLTFMTCFAAVMIGSVLIAARIDSKNEQLLIAEVEREEQQA
mgnify:CR=1 FL=1